MSDLDIRDIERAISSIGQSGLTYNTIASESVARKEEAPTPVTTLTAPTRYRSELRKIKNKINASLAIHNRMPELTHRELRVLACDHDLPVNNKSIYLRLLDAIKTAGIRSCLMYKNLLSVYFKRYRYFMENQAVFLPLRELWLFWEQRAQEGCDISNVAESPEVYFSADTPLNIARCVLDDKEKTPTISIDTLLLRHHLVPGSADDLLVETCGNIIKLCLDDFKNPVCFNVLLYEVLLPHGTTDKARADEIASELIRRLDSDGEYRVTCQKKLNKYFLAPDILGDPRNASCADNWSTIGEHSTGIFKRWLIEDDIVFFFKFLSDNISDAHVRRAFWLRFAGSIRDSRIFVSTYHHKTRREVIEKAREDCRELSSLCCDTGRLNSSCIVLDLDNRLYAVEFTEPDTAMYLYKHESFKSDLTQETLNIADLKKADTPTATQNTQMVQFYYHTSYPALRFYHSNNWQPFVEKYLSLYDIKPHPSP
ncbi:MAG: hypothetical protein HQL05_13675 [Nitrospirae bacterium]|uniref:EH signature domain-containing protein n=1 Tax=Candidatus Magnetobacterium casense TaxID=1455061 RepID=UPI00058E5DE5|nr:EH signature domain-containing protein [Candidatus Magnetobacterium casensis]MBF0338865.1 hypothetical protein [Nitrospirota bacterium]